jgi:hypothetical protein
MANYETLFKLKESLINERFERVEFGDLLARHRRVGISLIRPKNVGARITFGPFQAHCLASRRTSAMNGQQLLLGNHQVGQTEQAQQLRVVLGQPLVAGLLVPEQVLDDVKRVLYFGADAGLDLLDLLQHLPQRAVAEQLAFARLHRNVPLRPLCFLAFMHAAIARIAKRIGLQPVQQAPARVTSLTLAAVVTIE